MRRQALAPSTERKRAAPAQAAKSVYNKGGAPYIVFDRNLTDLSRRAQKIIAMALLCV